MICCLHQPDSVKVRKVGGLKRDETAEPVSRGRSFRRERGQGKFVFPVLLTTRKISKYTRLVSKMIYIAANSNDAIYRLLRLQVAQQAVECSIL